MLSYVSKAESTPEIAEVTGPRPPPPTAAVAGVGLAWGGVEARVAHVCRLLLQQRGERDSQTQAILTKLKCAAGEAGPARPAPPTHPRPRAVLGPHSGQPLGAPSPFGAQASVTGGQQCRHRL